MNRQQREQGDTAGFARVPLLHRHRWETLQSTYTEPCYGFKAGRLDYPEVISRLAHGFTTVSLRCQVCGDVDARVFLGRWEDKQHPVPTTPIARWVTKQDLGQAHGRAHA